MCRVDGKSRQSKKTGRKLKEMAEKRPTNVNLVVSVDTAGDWTSADLERMNGGLWAVANWMRSLSGLNNSPRPSISAL